MCNITIPLCLFAFVNHFETPAINVHDLLGSKRIHLFFVFEILLLKCAQKRA